MSYFYPKTLQLNQLTPKPLSPRIQFATLTHDNQIKPVHNLVKQKLCFFRKNMILILFELISAFVNSLFKSMIKEKTSYLNR